MKRSIKAILISLAFLATVACGGEAKEISVVKKGKVEYCKDYTVEDIVNASIEKPKWKSAGGYVNVSGITVSGKPANVVMQFWVRNNGEWGLQAFEVNGAPVSFAGLTIIEMCKAAQSVRLSENAKRNAERLSKTQVIPAELLNDSRDGKKYKTVKIGEQTWMAENLNYDVEGSKCYDNVPANCQKYGRLYDWKTAIKTCPNGWHLPSDSEWETLVNFTGGDKAAGKKLKAQNGWAKGNGTDDYDFSALPAGRYSKGKFESVNDFGSWWSATENKENAYMRTLRHDFSNEIFSGTYSKSVFFSVRCVKGFVQEVKDYGSPATAELEREAKKWQESNVWEPYKSIEGEYFTFKGTAKRITETGAGDLSWTATSKMKIGNCPAKSIWKMTAWHEEGRGAGENEIPSKCEFLTPKVIINHKFNEFE